MREAEDFGETSEDCRKIVWTSPRSPSESAPVGLCQQIGRFRKNVGRFSVDSLSVDFTIRPVDYRSFLRQSAPPANPLDFEQPQLSQHGAGHAP
jgi:hypothetical protein